MADTNIFDTITKTSAEQAQVAVDCSSIQGLCEVPLGNELLDAQFTREGKDLLVNTPNKLVVGENYFTHEASPTLISSTGKKVNGNTIDVLAKAEAPTEYAGPVATQPSIGIVETLEGSVTVKRGGVDIELKQGDTVFQNDVIQTADNSKVGITFEDKSVFSLGSDARMTLDSFVYDADTGEGASSINVIKGMFKFVSGEIAANNPGEMQVETPVATIGIRGTTGGGSVQGEGMENEFFLEPNADGTVGWFDVTTDAGTTSMNQPNTVVELTSFHQAPPPPAFVAPEQIQKSFGEVIDITPKGKYEARENAEQKEAVQEQQPAQENKEAAPEEVPAEEAAAEGEPATEEAATEGEAIETAPKEQENVEGEAPLEAAPQDVTAEGEIANTPDAGESVEAAAEEVPADVKAEEAQPMEPIKMTMSSEQGDASGFDQAMNTMEGRADGMNGKPASHDGEAPHMAEKHQEMMADMMEVVEEAEGEETAAEDVAEVTLQEQIDEDRRELVEEVLRQEAAQEAEAEAGNAPGSNAPEGDADLPPPPPPAGENDNPPPSGEGEGNPNDDQDGEDDTTGDGSAGGGGNTTNPVYATLTTASDDIQGAGNDDVFTVDSVIALDSTDSVHGSAGIDTLKFEGTTNADVSGLTNVSGIERIEIDTAGTTVTVDQAFIDQRDAGTPGIEVAFGANDINADLRNLDEDDNAGVQLNGTGEVTFTVTTADEFHQASNKSGQSIHFDLNQNNAAGEFYLDGGQNRVEGGGNYLGVDQEGGDGHHFTAATGSNDIELTNVNTSGTGAVTNIDGNASDLYVEIENSSLVNVSATATNGANVNIDTADDVTVTGGVSNDHFRATGDSSGLLLEGKGGADRYIVENFSGDALLVTGSDDQVILNNLASGADITIDHNSSLGANATWVESDTDFNNLNLSLNDENSDGKQELIAQNGGKTITFDGIDDVGNEYLYQEHGRDYHADFGLTTAKEARDLTSQEYLDGRFTQVNTTLDSSQSGTSLSNRAVHEVGSVFDDTVTTTGKFQKVYTYDGSDTIYVNNYDTGNANERAEIYAGAGNDVIKLGNVIDYVTVHGGEGNFDILDASALGEALTLDMGAAFNLTGNGGANQYVDQITGVEAFVLTAHNDTVNAGVGDQIINAGAGADIIDGGTGTDTVSYATSGAGVTVDLGITTQASTGDASGDMLTNIENLVGSSHDDLLTGDAGNNEFVGGAGNDTIDGAGAGGDLDTVSYEHSANGITLDITGTGTATATGEGNDTLINIENYVGSHNDDIIQLHSSSAFADYVQAGNGHDILKLHNAGGGAETIDLNALGAQVSGIETLDLTNGEFALTNVNSLAVQSLIGGEHHELIITGDANDTITLNTADWHEGDSDGGFSTYISNTNGVELSIADAVNTTLT